MKRIYRTHASSFWTRVQQESERVSVATVPLRQLVRRDERQKRRSDGFRTRAHDVHLRHSCRREQGLEDPENPGEEAGDVDKELLRLRTVSMPRPGASGNRTTHQELGIVALEYTGRLGCCVLRRRCATRHAYALVVWWDHVTNRQPRLHRYAPWIWII